MLSSFSRITCCGAQLIILVTIVKIGVRKIAPRSVSGFGLGLALELGMGGNFPRTVKIIQAKPYLFFRKMSAPEKHG